MKYRWDGHNYEEIREWILSFNNKYIVIKNPEYKSNKLEIRTVESFATASIGDDIQKINNDFYVIKN